MHGSSGKYSHYKMLVDNLIDSGGSSKSNTENVVPVVLFLIADNIDKIILSPWLLICKLHFHSGLNLAATVIS